MQYVADPANGAKRGQRWYDDDGTRGLGIGRERTWFDVGCGKGGVLQVHCDG